MPLFSKLTMRPPASALERILGQHPFQLFLASLYPVKGQLEIMLNVLLHSLSFIYSFLTDLKIVNANIKKKKKKERKKEKKVLLACKRPVKVDYGFLPLSAPIK